MKKTIFEEMGDTYIRQGDYLIPCLTLPEEEEQRFIGVWGQRHLRYQMEWVARMNNIQACVREIVDKEIIYQ